MVRVICIDDKNKPSIIPKSKWLKEEEEYNVIMVHTSLHKDSKNVLMFSLAEIDISDCEPYGAFKATRFAVHKDDIKALQQLAKDCTELNDIDITTLTEELKLA
jgi:hypothetical protein